MYGQRGTPLDFLRELEEQQQRQQWRQRLPLHPNMPSDPDELHSHSAEFEHSWGQPDPQEFSFQNYAEHRSAHHQHGSSYRFPGHSQGQQQPSGMDTFEELFALMHEHVSHPAEEQANAHLLLTFRELSYFAKPWWDVLASWTICSPPRCIRACSAIPSAQRSLS